MKEPIINQAYIDIKDRFPVFTVRLALVSLFLVCSLTGQAQVTQQGVVMEYQERQQKTPLDKVELVVAGAGSTSSDTQGLFKLNFRTMKAGDKVTVHRIVKTGYEIFNREALDQWHISRSNHPFLVVMCRTERFRKIRDDYERVASESYERQLKREEDLLAQQRKKNKMSEKAYKKALEDLRNEYDQRLENLDNYIDRFARIDQSELSEAENRIIMLVKDGKIDEAVKAYDALGLEDKYKREEAVVAQAQKDIDRLSEQHAKSTEDRDQTFAAIRRKNDLLYMAGGSENIAKIGKSLHRVAEADSTYYPALEGYANYLIEQQKPLEALPWLQSAEQYARNDEERITAKLERGTAYLIAGKFQEGVKYLDDADKDIATTYKEQEVMLLLMQRLVQEQKANMYDMRFMHQESYEVRMKDVQLLEKLVGLVPDTFDDSYANALIFLAHVEILLGKLDHANSHAQKAVEVYTKLCRSDIKKYELNLASVRHTLAEVFYLLRENDKALNLIDEALPVAERYYTANPRKHVELLADCMKLKGSILRTARRPDEAEKQLRQALKLNEETMAALPGQQLFIQVEANFLTSLGWVQHQQGKYSDAEKTFRKAIDFFNQIDSKGGNYPYEIQAYNGLGNALFYQGKREMSIPFYQRAIDTAEKVFRETPGLIANGYHQALYSMSSANFYTGKSALALQYAERDIALMQKYPEIKYDFPENSAIMGAYICHQGKQYDKALKYTELILQFIPSGVEHASFLGFKGQLFSEMGRQQEARKLWEQSLRLILDIERQTPDDLQLLDTKGELLLRLGRRDEATKVMQRILKVEPQYEQKHGQESGFYQLYKTMK